MSNIRHIPEGTSLNNPVYAIHNLESRLVSLDEQQQEISSKYPPGAQRIRGLAGSGKTVTFAQRAATIHKEHPDWKIAFIFFTRSLYDQIINERISTYYQKLSNGQHPNWNNLNVLHAWGAKDRDGFYRKLAKESGTKALNVNDVERIFGRSVDPGIAFEYICDQLEKQIINYPQLYDVILIDEGQDLPPAFYRLARNTLTEPKRLYWAYDEAQGIGSLIVPKAKAIFGENVVNLRGRAENFKISYRTPKQLLMIAHAVNMGLLRDGGVLQGVSEKEEWENLGYTVLEGDFSDASVKEKKLVKIERQYDQTKTDPQKHPVNLHPIDQNDFPYQDAIGDILKIEGFENEEDEQEWIAQQVANDLHQGLNPRDIIITSLCGDDEKIYFKELKQALTNYEIPAYIAGTDGSRDIFQKDGCVTISNIYRAKGNEAYKVYACRFDCATKPLSWKEESELHKRNEALVAITRARIWCVVTGLESPIFAELRQYKEQFPYLIFPAFNKNSLKRVTDELD